MRRLREIEPERPYRTSGGHAEIVDFGELDLPRPDGKPVVRRRSLSREERRVVAGALAIVLLGSTLWAWSQPRVSATSSAPSPIAAVRPTVDDATTPPASVAATTPELLAPTDPLPSVAGGWVRRVDVPMGSGQPAVTTGPDGTIYVSGSAPLDRAGNARIDWLRTPGGEYAQPVRFSPDGRIYGVTTGSDTAVVWGFTASGDIMFSFQLPTTAWVQIALAPGGIDVVAPSVLDPDPSIPDQVFVVDDRGTIVTHWALDGQVVNVGPTAQFLVRGDGSVVAGVQNDGGCATEFLDQSGAEIGPKADCWDSLAQAPDGSVLARRCTRYTVGLGATSDTGCAESLLEILDDAGKPAPGWPHLIAGDLSGPTFDGAGRAYFAVNDTEKDLSGITAIDPNGKVPAGWPVMLDANAAYFDWTPPIVTGEGVLAWSGTSLYSFGLDGAWSSGSPSVVVGYPGGPAVYVPERDFGMGALFFGVEGGVEAVSIDGHLLGFYRDGAANLLALLGILPASDGAVTLTYHAGNNQAYVLVAFLPAIGF